jgi:16S rRNA (guanine527-N7)-methyltransferase
VKHNPGASPAVSRETQARLDLFHALFLRWNPVINLVSRRDEARVGQRHIQDSLQLVPLIPGGTDRAIDLGSGGGFPGLILAIATGLPFDLVEADGRKAAFLREAARETGAPATVHAVRIEAADIAPARLLTARALAPLPELLELSARLVAPGGVALFPKGEKAQEELTNAQAKWQMVVERFASQTDPAGVILRISEVARA